MTDEKKTAPAKADTDERGLDQAHRAFDDSPQRFRERNAQDQFSGASGVLFEQAMAQTRMAICLSDPHAPDEPIVFANRAFIELTGYPEEEIVGRNCRFLQGPDTDPTQVAKIREAIADERVVVVEVLNYRKDGTPFWNALHLGPIYDDQENLIYYFGSQWDVSDVHAARADEKHAMILARELSHRIKNVFSVIGGIVTVTGRTRGIREDAEAINERIQALGRAYEPTLDDASLGTIEAGQAIKSVLAPYDPEGGRIHYHGNGVRTDPTVVSTLGLALHELATNAIKYGALSTVDGHIDVDWRLDAGDDDACDHLAVEWRETGGPPVEAPSGDEGTGFGIIDTLLNAAEGSLGRDWRAEGLHAVLRVPSDRLKGAE